MRRTVLVLTVCALGMSGAAAAQESALAAEIAEGLETFMTALDDLGGFEAFDETLPLMSTTPTEALSLDTVFGQALSLPGPFADLAALQAAIDSADHPDVNGVSVNFDNVMVVANGALVDVTFDMALSRTLDLPIDLPIVDGAVDTVLKGGGVPVSLAATLDSLAFQLDTSITGSTERFYLIGGAALDASITSSPDPTGFATNIGFLAVSVDPQVSFDLHIPAQLNDPDSDGRITRDEWQSTAVEDLVTVSSTCTSNGSKLEISSSLLTGTSTIELTDCDTLTINWDELDRFSTVSATTVLQGLNALASTVRASQVESDVPLPFLGESLAEVFSFAQPLADFIEQYDDGAIVCGSANEDPPRGSLLGLEAGSSIYCQIITLETPTTVTWGGVDKVTPQKLCQPGTDCVADPAGTVLETAGPNPTLNVLYRAPASGLPDVDVQFTDALGGSHSVRRRFLTAQEMAGHLEESGFDAVSDLLTYNGANNALTFHLRRSFTPIQPGQEPELSLDFSDQLEADAGIKGLGATGSASATINPGSVTVDLIFGVLLENDPLLYDPACANPAPGHPCHPSGSDQATPDRFFLQRAGSQPLLGLPGLTADVDVELKGMIGFVEVAAKGDAGASGACGAAFQITGGSPMLAVDIEYGANGNLLAPDPVGAAGLANAIRFRELLRQLAPSDNRPGRIRPVVDLRMCGGLKVSATVGGVTIDGGVELEWEINDLDAVGTPKVTASSDLNDKLKVFDIDPPVIGKHEGGGNSQSLGVGTVGTFVAAELVDGTLRNLTDGSRCIVGINDVSSDGKSINCTLQGGEENDWDTGDRFVVGGNPRELLSLILDNLEEVLAKLEGAEDLDTELPLVARTPRQLLTRFDDLKSRLQEFRLLRPLAQIVCSLGDKPTERDSSNKLVLTPLVNLQSGNKVSCQGTQLDASLVSALGGSLTVEWKIEGGSATGTSTDINTVVEGPADENKEWVQFIVNTDDANPGASTDAETFQISLILGNSDTGLRHPVRFPEAPLTLQTLADRLACQLGIPAGSLTLDLEGLGSLPPDPSLIVGLRYGVCSNPSESVLTCAKTAAGDLIGPQTDPLSAEFRIPLPAELGELIGVGSSTVKLDYGVDSRFEIEVPLADPENLKVRDVSGLEVSALVQAAPLPTLTGNVGPLKLELGDGEAKLGATLRVGLQGGDVTTAFGGLSQNCGQVQTTVVEASGTGGPGDDASKKMKDATADFRNLSVADNLTLRNTTDASSCEISGIEMNNTLVCDGGLQGGRDNAWQAGDEYEVEKPGAMETLAGDACARMGLMADVGGTLVELGDLGFEIDSLVGNVPRRTDDSLTERPGWFLVHPRSLQDNVDARDLALALLLKALPIVMDNIESALESAESVPLVGDSLMKLGGAVENARTQVVDPLKDLVVDLKSQSVGALEDEVRELICKDTIDCTGEIFFDVNGDKSASADDVLVTGYCDAASSVRCATDAPLQDLDDLRVTIVLGQGGEPDPEAPGAPADAEPGDPIPIDFGVPGLPIEITQGELTVDYGWRLPFSFGLSRSLGPYLCVGDACETGVSGAGSFRIGANVEIAAPATPKCGDQDDEPTVFDEYSTARCITGKLGFLESYLRDHESDPSSSSVVATAGLTSGGGGPTPLCELLSGAAFTAGIGAETDVDLAFRTGFERSAAAALPSVLGTVHLVARFAAGSVPPCDDGENGLCSVGYDNLHLDVGSFFSGFVKPAVQEVQNVTKPLMPVIDTVRAPLPVVSDLSQAVGQGPVTLLTLVELQNCPPPQALGGEAKCTKLIRNLADLVTFVNKDFPDDEALVVPLGPVINGVETAGSFAVNVAEVRKGKKKTPDQSKELVDTGGNDPNKKPKTKKNAYKGTSRTPGSLSFPFLEDSGQIFGLLMGQDIVLIRYDAGTMSAGAGFNYRYGPFLVGPVPVEVTIGGSVVVDARFAMGYDTSGVRQVLEGGSGLALIDGIFIDDLDKNGCDVPEITLVGEVFAGAGVSIVVAAAGLKGGLTMTTDLNLDDRPDPDGKLRIDEIVNKLHNPLCLFVVSGRLEAFLAGWVRVGVEWFSKEWEIDFVRVTLLDFEVKCDPPPPRLADTADTHGGSPSVNPVPPNQLRLNLGDFAARRGVQANRIDEKLTVRQAGERTFEVTGFGLNQTFTVPGNGPVTIWARGSDGNDEIVLEAGVVRDRGTIRDVALCDTDGDGDIDDSDDFGRTCPFHDDRDLESPFTAKADIRGGPGDDIIKTGAAADTIWGDEGNDRIQAGAGADMIWGGSGNDNLGGEGGNDQIWGGDGNDVVAGGPGQDQIWGGADSDELNGGWLATQCAPESAVDPNPPTQCQRGPDDPVLEEDPRYDLTDTIHGDSGDDVVNGGFGDDVLFGDAGNDHLNGGPGDDELHGGDGRDALGGEEGNDRLYGEAGNDLLDGDDPLATEMDCAQTGCHDQLFGGTGHDGLFGRVGNDRLVGGPGNDELFGGEGFDDLLGGAGRDLLDGGPANDLLVGDSGTIGVPTGFPTPASRGTSEVPPLDAGLSLSDVQLGPEADGSCVEDGLGGLDDCEPEVCFRQGDETTVPRQGVGGGNFDCLFGGDGHDLLFGENGNDGIYGAAGDDFAEGGAGNDLLRGGKGRDVLYGHQRADRATNWRLPGGSVSDTMLEDDDSIFGDSGEDGLFGGPGRDLMRGGMGDDYAEGNQDEDEMFGDGGQDDLIGGSSVAATPDAGDTILGNADSDVLTGDNAQISRTGAVNAFDGSLVRRVVLLDLETQGGGDTMSGNQGNDRMWGGLGNDVMRGNEGDDHLEGNAGDDLMAGDSGQDDLIGGTGRTTILTGQTTIDDRATAEDGRADGADTICGGTGDPAAAMACDGGSSLIDDFDVVAGDNAIIDRPLEGGHWQTNSYLPGDQRDGVKRDVWLLDVAAVSPGESPAASVSAASSGNDILYGEAGEDLMWGQGGDDDMHGGGGQDIMQGNAGLDSIHGDGGNDDLIGGTGRINDDGPTGVDGRLDGADTMHGGDGYDVMAGDNALLIRSLVGGQWALNTFDGGTRHERRILLDVDSPDADLVSGADVMAGDGENDLMYGQGGNDTMNGNDGDDLMEGNAGMDEMHGDAGQDDMFGGTTEVAVIDDGDGVSDIGDEMTGDDGGDVMLGDNGQVTRLLDDEGKWRTDPNTGDVIRSVHLYDVALVAVPADDSLSGGDVMEGGRGRDFMFGQGGGDTMNGGEGPDVMEGNHGADSMRGEGGEDDMVGGGSSNTGMIGPSSMGNGLLDANDAMWGGEEGDVMAGDNARIVRLVDALGMWIEDPNVDDALRSVALFDVQVIGGARVDPATAGSDQMFGDAGRDLMFGQGNLDGFDEDLDGRWSEDPPDGVDNDHDGRESGASVGYDCEDHRDNDGDGLVDRDDPECQLAIDEDPGGDEMQGGSGVDYMEGNHGSDWMWGDDGEDDMIGGSSAGDGLIGGGASPAGLEDGDDVMAGGAEDDLIASDNAIVTRPLDGAGRWLRLSGFGYDLAVRETTMSTVPEPEGAFGHDYAIGEAGEDEIYGQLGNDYLVGGFGDDAILGDLGRVSTSIEDGSRSRRIRSKSPFLEDDIFVAGTLYRLTELFSFEDGQGGEGHDVLLGGDGDDTLHGGPGDDVMNGDGDGIPTGICAQPFLDPDPSTTDEDHLFGGDGNDAAWGGRGHDHVWGGWGDDHLDVKPQEALAVQTATQKPGEGEGEEGPSPQAPFQGSSGLAGPVRGVAEVAEAPAIRPVPGGQSRGGARGRPEPVEPEPADPPEWHTWGVPDNSQGRDLVHGGWDQDALQADEGGAGPVPGDRLIDWAGAYNVYYVCPAAYGEGYINRAQAPHVQRFLQDLAESDGALTPTLEGSSGFRELAYVFHRDVRLNSHPRHPRHPGHFTCACEEQD